MKNNLDISCTTISDDYQIFKSVIDQGIDSRLEAFTKSKFEIKKEYLVSRLYMEFDESEIQILLRRLEELEEKAYENRINEEDESWERIDSWIIDILDAQFDIEVI
mgnify:CR=1 FL=1|tara:strand:+ start:224 stop:541 length:318 start_codon:yes stop_codon:yes gene_type:complete